MVRFQKLTRNLFLTLHEHNVHRQQRQLSKFLMRCQQFASHAYCGAVGSVLKMASQQEKAFCVLRFEVSRSVITVQRAFRARFRKDAPCRSNINRWYRQFVETGWLCKGKSPGRPRVYHSFVYSLYKHIYLPTSCIYQNIHEVTATCFGYNHQQSSSSTRFTKDTGG